MTITKEGKALFKQRNWREILPYSLLAVLAFGLGLLLLMIFLRDADKIVALGLTDPLFYIVLIPFALCVATFLFGAMRSFGIYRGKLLGGKFELGGPAVGFLLVIVLGFTLPRSNQNFSVTVIAHGHGSETDIVLRSSGLIILDTGEVRRTAPIGPNGEAVFVEIPANMRGRKASLGIDADGFESAAPNPSLLLSPGTYYMEIRRKAGLLSGHVYDRQHHLLSGVSLSVGSTRVTTDDQGYFEMQILNQPLTADVTLIAMKPGYSTWSGLEVPNSNEVTITLQKE